jgi:hypothetical protein
MMVSSHDTLEEYFKTNFNLMYFHKFSLTEIEGMLPWEKDVYVSLLVKQLEEEKQQK